MQQRISPVEPTRLETGARTRWSRRRVLRAGATLGALTFPYLLGGRWQLLTPRQAQAAGAELRVLTDRQARLLELLAECLVPGARDAGIVPYLDAQLAADPAETLLILRYLDVSPPYLPFYDKALRAFRKAAGMQEEDTLPTPAAAERVIAAIMHGEAVAWASDAPPASFFFFVLRADAIDVTYGTPEGFAGLGIDYVPHIPPKRPW